MFAIISDIHANLEALTAVLDDIRSRGLETIYCLGDVVGYGPDPGPCLDMVSRNCREVIIGNHDYAVLYEPSRFNLGAENAVFWTRRILEDDPDTEAVKRRWKFLGSKNVRKVLSGSEYGIEEFLLVHGSPRRPINEYLFPEDINNNPAKILGVMERFSHLCFVGHTHMPGVFTSAMEFLRPDDIDYTYQFDDEKTLINVGSVGQPRDHDPRASYVIVEQGKITFARVEYDVQTTMEKVLAISELDDYMGIRLQDGR
ncbi:MAG: metallophosphatase family protein [Phycisphaerae bacterium]|nr:metallophosphatase family protein [Phycisphaerae bacterium]